MRSGVVLYLGFLSELRSRLLSSSVERPGLRSVRWVGLGLWTTGAVLSHGLAALLDARGDSLPPTRGVDLLVVLIALLAGWGAGVGTALELRAGRGDAWPPIPRLHRQLPPISAALLQWGLTCWAYVLPWVHMGLVLGGTNSIGRNVAAIATAMAWASAGLGTLWTALVGWGTRGQDHWAFLSVLPPAGAVALLVLGWRGDMEAAALLLGSVSTWNLLLAGVGAGLAAAAVPGYGPGKTSTGPARSWAGVFHWGRTLSYSGGLFVTAELLRLSRRRSIIFKDVAMIAAVTLLLLRVFENDRAILEMVVFFLPFSLGAAVWLPAVGSDGSLLELVRGAGRLPEYLVGMLVPAVGLLATSGALVSALVLGSTGGALGIFAGVLAAAVAVGVGALAANRGQRLHPQDNLATWGHAVYWVFAGTAATLLSLAAGRGGSEGTVALVSFGIVLSIPAAILLAAGVHRLERGA